MLCLIALLLVRSVVKVGSLGMTSFSTYTLIDRMQLSKCCITSLCPKALLTHSPRSVIVERGGASPISEVIWLPCPFSLNSLDDVDSAPDDDHFASKLCDKGYTIHAIEPKAGSCFVATLIEVFRWRIEKHKIPGSAICVIANELTCTHVLNYLSDIKLGVHNQYLLSKFNVGAVVLIDPPPLHALSTTQGRRNILKRYLVPIQQLKAERKQKTINQTKKVKKVKSRRQLEREKKMPLRSASRNEEELTTTELFKYFERLQKKGSWGECLLQFDARDSSDSPFHDIDFDASSWQPTIDNWNPHLMFENFADGNVGDSVLWDYEDEEDSEDGGEMIGRKLLGAYPTRFQSIAEAMKGRLLVINSQFPTAESNSSIGDADHWGKAAIEEFAEVFQAPSVVQVRDESTKQFEEAQRHQRLADVIDNWLSGLQRF